MKDIYDVYKTVTKCFLRQFDIYWNDMLVSLGTSQIQLISGHRLRPQFCLWGYLAAVRSHEIESIDLAQAADVSVSIEMVHKASILLDDWIDHDSERHGRPAFHTEHGPEYTVLYALNLIGTAMSRLQNIFPNTIILQHHYSLCLDTVLKTICSMAKGALEEVQLQNQDIFNSDKIREIIQLETAEIIGNSMLLGYYVKAGADQDRQIVDALKKMGDQCGYLFQALNDLEAFGSPQLLTEHKGNLNSNLSIISSEIPENAGVFSVFATSELAFSLVFSLMGRNKGKFFYTAPTT